MVLQYDLDFLGTTVVNKLFSSPMVPWIIADVKRRKTIQKVTINIENGEIIGKTDGVTIFHHHTSKLARFYPEPNNSRVFMYLIRADYEPVLNVYLFQAPTIEDVLEICHAMRDSTKEQGQKSTKLQNNETTLTSLCPDISPTNSQFFEVLYVGKVKVSHRKVPETFVDEALERIRMCELEKSKKLLERLNEDIEKGKNLNLLQEVANNEPATNEGTSNADKMSSSDYLKKNSTGQMNKNNSEYEEESDKYCDKFILKKPLNFATADEKIVDAKKNGSTCGRARAGSMGVIETFKKKTEDSDENRTLLFYIGQTDLRLISPDSKQVVLHKILKDIHCCLQGLKNSLHFAIIGIEVDGYVSYVFKCESEGVVEHIVSVISQSFKPLKESKEKKKQPLLSCEHCPMVWYHKLCAEVEGQHDKKTQLAIFKKIETLPEQEQTDIHTKFLRAESSDIKDQNEFLMMLLRIHCEGKQSRHIHDTAETRSEFLNQVLGGNTIFMKAKRSLTNSFDHLLKRKGSQTDILNSKESSNGKNDSNSHEPHRPYITVGPTDGEIIKNEISKQLTNIENLTKFHKETSNGSNANCQVSPSFEDIAVMTFNNKKIEKSILSSSETRNDLGSPKTPMINIFLRVGSSSKSPPQDSVFSDLMNQTPSRSWRQAIFDRVVTPGKVEYEEKINRKKTKNELRLLWKTAINQQILLIRMEKENARLKASQVEATVKRIKLEYDDLGNSTKEISGFWDTFLSKDNKNSSKYNDQMLFDAVKQGIPRSKRGDVWQFFAFRNHSKQESVDFSSFSNYNVPYEKLLKQLTSFQHCILIDLGRTFPNHPYFSSPLGPGQLSLFNLLKGYSLLDPQVGYCQGLSFVAGVLLLHMSEESAFSLLKHLMFVRGLRNQYLPNMAALQVQLYQLSRLIHDTLPKLYTHFDKNEIAPTLYAASWILTLFASQFPLGFVTRVFDLLFFEQTTEVLFKVIMALLEEHTGAILKISGFEEIMNYLKTKVTTMDSVCVERIMKKVLSMNISKQLHDFEIEYHVLQEEMSSPRPEIDQLRKLKIENKQLIDQNLAYKEKLEVANIDVTRLEKLKFSQQVTINNLEAEIKNLERTAKFLGDFILDVSDEHKYVNVPAEIRRLIKNLESYKQNNSKVSKKPFDKTAFFKRIHSSIDFYEKPHFSELCTPDDLPNGTKYGTQTKDEKNNDKEKSNNKTVLKGLPLKVIADDNDDERIVTFQQNSPKLTSKITSGVSSFFNSSPNQIIKNQKNKKTLQENSNGSLSKNAETSEKLWTKHEFSSEIGTLNMKKSVIHPHLNEKLKNDPVRESKSGEVIIEKVETDSSKNFFPKDTSIHFHPLDSCEDVNITYNGTTQLKSIKSGGHKLIRNATIDLIPVNNNQFLHISENDIS